MTRPGTIKTARHLSLPEIGGDAAFYFDSFEPEHMQHVLSKGLKEFHDKDLSARTIAHAEQFDWQTTARQYLKLYDECLTGE